MANPEEGINRLWVLKQNVSNGEVKNANNTCFILFLLETEMV